MKSECSTDIDAEQALAFGHYLANCAREIALRYFRTPLDVTLKTDASPVTAADEKLSTYSARQFRSDTLITALSAKNTAARQAKTVGFSIPSMER